MTTFADISHHQTVSLVEYSRAGFDRIAIKATGGALNGALRYVDPQFRSRWGAAGNLQLARVAYHFARNENGGAAEFAWCWSQIQDAGGFTSTDVLCYDQEDSRSPQTTALARQRTLEFVAAAVAAGITTGWLYSGKWFLEPAGIVAADLPAGWRNLWMSDYSASQADADIEVPAGWTRAHIVARQYSDSAEFPGIPGPCDASRVTREWLGREDIAMADAASLEAQIKVLSTKLDDMHRLQTVGDAPDAQGDKGGHPNNMERIRADIAAMRTALGTQLTAQAAALQAATKLLAERNGLTVDEVRAAVERAVSTALDAGTVSVDVSVHGQAGD